MQLNALAIEGVTAFSPAELTPLYEGYLTREVGVSDLVAIATAITDKYRANGYFLSQAVVPPQSPGTGVGRIVVYEGYIGSVAVTGRGESSVKRYLDKIESRRPLRLTQLDQALALAGDVPGLTLKPRLEPDLNDPARHSLVVDSAMQRVTASVYTDNRGPKTAGPWQTYFNGAINSALMDGDRLGAAVLTAPAHPRDFTYIEANYAAPTGAGWLRGFLGASKAHDGPDTQSPVAGGQSWSTGLAYELPLVRSRLRNVSAIFSGNVRHTEQDWNDVGGYRDDVRVARVALNATLGPLSKSTNLSSQLSIGERGDPGADPGRGLSRANAAQNFWKISGRVAHYRDLGPAFGMYLSADAQWSPKALLASEEMAIGGAPYGRGYSYAEISGDSAIAGTAELRAGVNPNWGFVSFVQGYGFIDAGKVWNSAGGGSAALASAGIGLRIRFGPRATLGLEAARPLTRTPYEHGDKDWRSFVSLSARI